MSCALNAFLVAEGGVSGVIGDAGEGDRYLFSGDAGDSGFEGDLRSGTKGKGVVPLFRGLFPGGEPTI